MPWDGLAAKTIQYYDIGLIIRIIDLKIDTNDDTHLLIRTLIRAPRYPPPRNASRSLLITMPARRPPTPNRLMARLLPPARRLAGLCLMLAAATWTPTPVQAQAQSTPLRVGILPFSGPLESRNDWHPLLADLAAALGQEVETLSVSSYEALDTAIQRQQVDLSLLSGKMALNAVTRHGMRVIAQVEGGDAGYRALLLTRKGGPVTQGNLWQAPGRWRLARGSALSLSGYVAPYLQLFLPNGIRPEHYFRSEQIGNHQDNALAVANGEADLATGNSADLDRFRARFPAEHGRIEVLWASAPLPPAVVVVHTRLDAGTQARIARFLTAYGRGDDEAGRRQRQTLEQLHRFIAFQPADNDALQAPARLVYELARDSALSAQWISQAALQQRLRRLADDYGEQRAQLTAPAPGLPPM